MWKIKTFDELTNRELYSILGLRYEVFTVEQTRMYQDMDGHDYDAVHVFDEVNGKIVAYARVFMERKQVVTFGRVVIKRAQRGKGLGNLLMQKIMQAIKEYFPGNKIEIEAQVPVRGYYEKFDFEAIGDEFILAGSPHIKMVHDAI